jgi:hypothetical protein
MEMVFISLVGTAMTAQRIMTMTHITVMPVSTVLRRWENVLLFAF